MHLLHDFAVFFTLFIGVIISGPLIVTLCVSNFAFIVPARRKSTKVHDKATGSMIILVPAHNEELVLGRTLESLARATSGTRARVLVITHNCTDETLAIASAAGVLVEELREDLGGKGRALACGFRVAFEDYKASSVLVIDADTLVTDNAVSVAIKALEWHHVIQLRYGLSGGDGSPLVQLRRFAFHCMNHIRPLGRRRLGLSAGILGNGFGLSHQVFQAVPYSAHSIVEDVELHLSLVQQGFACHYVTEAAVCGDIVNDRAAVGIQAARWEGGRLLLLRTCGPALLRKVLGGEVRLLEPLLDLAGLPVGFVAPTLLALLLVPSSVTRIYAGMCLAVLVIHITIGALLCGEHLVQFSSLAYLPVYVLRKLITVPRIEHVVRGDSPWQATRRNEAQLTQQALRWDWSWRTYTANGRKLLRMKEASHASEH